MKAKFKKLMRKFNTFDKIYFAAYCLALIICIIIKASLISVVMVFISLLGGQFNSKRTRMAMLFLAIAAVLYGYISYTNGFVGETIINWFYSTISYIVAFFTWNRKKETAVFDEIKHIKRKTWLILLPSAAVFAGVYGYLLTLISGIEIFGLRFAEVSLPYLNSLSTAIIILAVFFTSRRYFEQWYIWLSSNVVLLIMWIIAISQGGSNDYALVVQNLAYIGININGLLSWRKIDKYLNLEFSEEYNASSEDKKNE